MKKIKINVEGMHCKSCEMLVDDALNELKGLHGSKANHRLGCVDVTFDESKIREDDIIKSIVKEGYIVRR